MTESQTDGAAVPKASNRVVSRERVIAAEPDRIFALLADPRRHPEIDGSGTVREAAVDAPEELVLGSKFGMAMRLGVPYRMINTVTDFEPGRRIAWAPRPSVFGRELPFAAGRVWRYELEPVDGGTRVRETWDATKEQGFALEQLLGTTKKVARDLEATLERIAAIVE